MALWLCAQQRCAQERPGQSRKTWLLAEGRRGARALGSPRATNAALGFVAPTRSSISCLQSGHKSNNRLLFEAITKPGGASALEEVSFFFSYWITVAEGICYS